MRSKCDGLAVYYKAASRSGKVVQIQPECEVWHLYIYFFSAAFPADYTFLMKRFGESNPVDHFIWHPCKQLKVQYVRFLLLKHADIKQKQQVWCCVEDYWS